MDVPSHLLGPTFTDCASLVGINEQVLPVHVIHSQTLSFRVVDRVWN